MRSWKLVLCLFLLLVPLASAQMTIELIRPSPPMGDGSGTGYTATCAEAQTCTLDQTVAETYCTMEGTYFHQFKAGYEPTTNHGGQGESYLQGSHSVNWDTDKWCRGEGDEERECLAAQVDWLYTGMQAGTTSTGYCCGASFFRAPGVSECEERPVDCQPSGYSEIEPTDDYPYDITQRQNQEFPDAAFDQKVAEGKIFYTKCRNYDENPNSNCRLREWTEADVEQWMGWTYPQAAWNNRCWRFSSNCERRGPYRTNSRNYKFYEATEECIMEEVCFSTIQRRDCGHEVGVNICGEVDTLSFEWGQHGENTGDIYDYVCANASVVSDGTQWLACGDIKRLNSQLPELASQQITRGSTTHGYACGETNPAKIDGYAGVVECVGRGAAISTTGGGVATTGENISPDLMFRTTTDGTSLTQVQSEYNFAPLQGKIALQVTPTWDGSDTEPRIFLSIDDDPNGVGNYIRIRKTGTNLVCQYNAVELQFDISDYEVEDGPIDVKYYFKADNEFTCEVRGIPQTAGAGAPLDPVLINIGDHAQTGEEAGGQVYVEIYGAQDPRFYYCVDDGRFLSNLDGLDYDLGIQTCEIGAGLVWTGSKCCSEAEDIFEYYNDYNGTGACFNSTGFFNGEPAEMVNDSIIAVAGEWYGCDLLNNDPILLEINDSHAEGPLIQDNETCDVFTDIDAEDNNFVCTTQGRWMFTPSKLQHVPKEVPFPSWPYNESPQSECCGLDSCWNGTQCIGNQVNESVDRTFEGYRCVNGQWGAGIPKKTWDRSSRGYCPEASDCLVHPLGVFEDNYKPEEYIPGQPQDGPACIADGQYVEQYLCDDGAWTTRTKWIGLHLMDYVEPTGDYSLFCDDWGEVLNFVDYKDIDDARAIQEYIGQTCLVNGQSVNCVNEFCAVRYNNGQEVAFGVSLNAPIDDPGTSFLKALGGTETACDNAVNGDEFFDLCSGIDNVYYNDRINSIIYATEDIGRRSYTALASTHLPTVGSSMKTLTDFNEDMALLQDYAGFYNESTLFDKWYRVVQGSGLSGKEYFGYMGTHQWNGSYLNYIGIYHQNFPASDPDGRTPCDMAEQNIDNDRPRDCEYDGDLKFVAYSTETYGNVRNAWRDLTAKLRI